MDIDLRAMLLMIALAVVITVACITGSIQMAVRVNSFLEFSPLLKRTLYCQQIGDDNCDGMIMSYESGWKCVPSGGGPLLCEVGNG